MTKEIFKYELKDIPVNEIDIGDRVRKELGEVALLAADLEQFGLHHPILVLDTSHIPEERRNTHPYLLLAGGRRLEAAKINSWDVIPAKIATRFLSEWEISAIELHENLQRKDMTPLEEGNSKAKMHRLYQEKYGVKKAGPNQDGHGLADTAVLLGESKASLSMDLKIAKYAPMIPDLAHAKTKSDARKMMKQFDDDVVKQELADRAQRRLKKVAGDITKDEDKRRRLLLERYVVGDFFEEVKKVQARSLDLLESDPDWGIMLKEAVEKRGAITADEYSQVAPDEYKDMVSRIAREANRILKDNAWMIFWYSIEEWHKETRAILELHGFTVCPMPCVWVHDSNYTATPAYRLGQRTEFFYYARKGDVRLGIPGKPNIFTFRSPKKNERFHIAEKPIELYEEILRVFLGKETANASTLTGFAGSGNFLLAAENLNHNAIGFDLSPKFKDRYTLKVQDGAPGQYKTYII